jgi:pyridoxamine 5'-phosphate oxidase
MTAHSLPDPGGTRDPLHTFREWYGDAERAALFLPEAACLSSATLDGAPSSRMVLLKEVDDRGFVFFTNYESRKGAELDGNPRAALLFHWATLERQVRVEGSVERISHEESVAYFRTRDRGSQIGAWASKQSRELRDREEIEEGYRDIERRFEGEEVPLPPFWGGYRVVPLVIEFWQGRANRLHDRVRFQREAAGSRWRGSRLYP